VAFVVDRRVRLRRSVHRLSNTGRRQNRVVRHPGYLGSLIQMPGAAVALGSQWGLGLVVFIAIVIVVRTALEDRTLRAELAGYEEYTRQEQYRLVPGIW
jgi:protein-S-isoprenylcysteine O-methyltransferase Ste14